MLIQNEWKTINFRCQKSQFKKEYVFCHCCLELCQYDQLGQIGWYCYFDHPYSCWFSVHLFYRLLRGIYRNLWLWLWICLFIFVILRFLLYIFQNFIQFSSVTQSYLTFCDPMSRSTPGILVHHQLPEFTQTQVHWVGDAIQPSHPLSSPSPPAFNLSQSLFKWVSSSHQVAKVLEFQLQHQSFQWTPRTDLL